MTYNRSTLVCTVGTSLFSNLNNIPNNNFGESATEIIEAYQGSNWKELAKCLLTLDPCNRICGAEINTIQEAQTKKWLSIRNIHFLVSDTEEGRNTGKILYHYFKNRSDLDLSRNSVEVHVVDKLQDEQPNEFRRFGLRNLVKKVGEIIQRAGGHEFVAIDATGGYKAQIAVAVLIGQALDIPVFYKHERFSEIIDFPPLPVSLDYDILGANADILLDFERGEILTEEELGKIDRKLLVFLDEIRENDKSIYGLNAIGQLYLTSFRLRYPKIIQLVDLESKERSLPSFGNDHHYPAGFKEFVIKVWRENRWIKTCYTVPFAGQAGIKGVGFKVRQEKEEKLLMGTYRAKEFGARFVVRLSDESIDSLNWAANYLNGKYRS